MDQSLKIWDLKQSYYEDDPIVIYDHDDEVCCADIRKTDNMLASMDILGIIHLRNITDLADAETILFTINSVPKEMDDFARVFFNHEKPGSEAEILILINDVLMALDIQGRQIDSTAVRNEHTLL